VTLFHLFALFPGFLTPDRQKLVNLASVINVMLRDTNDNLVERKCCAPMHGAQCIKLVIVQVRQVALPAAMRLMQPVDHSIKIAL
jgi:hypothetical protein